MTTPSDRLSTPKSSVTAPALSFLGAIAAAVTDAGYLMLIQDQHVTNPPDHYSVRVLFVAVLVASLSLAGMISTVLLARGRMIAAQVLLRAAATAAAALGFLAIFSIGLALIITAALMAGACASAVRHAEARPGLKLRVAAMAAALLALAIGFVFTGGL